MLSFFRRIINSRAGVVVTLLTLGVIALAFAAGDVSGLRTGGMGVLGGNSVATVGRASVTAAQLRQAAQEEVQALRQERPGLDMAQYVAAGGLDAALDRLVDGLAFQQFAAGQGMAVSRRSVDGQIASIPALQGPTGKFDQRLYEQILAQRHLSDAQVRDDLARELARQRLVAPTQGATQVPNQLALPYASLLLERRRGQVAVVPAAAMPAGPAPTPAELQAYYGRNVARYTVPERRVVRYALVTPAQVAAEARPSDADVQRYYDANRARYAPSEKRTISQVIVADQAGAAALAAQVRGGRPLADAARAAGLEASTQGGVDKAAYAGTAGQAAADAAFGGRPGAVVGPVRAALGFVVARVDAVTPVAGRTLAQARPEITAELTRTRTADALGRLSGAIDDALGGGATFDEVVADHRLAARATPALLADGTDPDDPAAAPDPALAPVVRAGFTFEEGDQPQVVPVGQDGGFALVAPGRTLPSAPRPLAQVQSRVAADLAADRALQAARRVAEGAAAQAGRGTPLAQALAGARTPQPRPVDAARAQVLAGGRRADPALALLFSMAPGTAKAVEAPDRGGWLVVKLDAIQPGNAAGDPGLVREARADLGRTMGASYVAELTRAVRRHLGVTVDAGAVARVRAELLGQSGN